MTLGNHHPDESASADKGSAAAEETAPVLPEANYEGYEVRVLNNISNFAYTNIGEEGLTGESLDDEVYNRNKIVEEELNITFAIEKKEVGETKAIIQELVLADDDAYDFYTCDLNIVMSHAMNGCDVNVVNIDTLELDQLWWNKPATDSISIGDSVYAFFGDLHTGYFESHNIVAFNKEMITNLGLSPPLRTRL